MKNRLTSGRRITPGTVLGCTALAIALAQPAQAAVQAALPQGSVGTAQLKNSAVTSAKIKDRDVRVVDLAPAARPRLPRAVVGALNEWRDLTPDKVTYLSVSLPSGRWALTGKGHTTNFGSTASQFCWLTRADGTELDFADSYVNNSGTSGVNLRRSVLLATVVRMSSPGRVDLRCSGFGNVGYAKLIAVEVR